MEKGKGCGLLSGEKHFFTKPSAFAGAEGEGLPRAELPVAPHALRKLALVLGELLPPRIRRRSLSRRRRRRRRRLPRHGPARIAPHDLREARELKRRICEGGIQ